MKTFDLSKLTSNMFRRVDNVVWDLMTGKIGIIDEDGGIATLEGSGDDAQINVNLMQEFGVVIPAYAQSTQPDAVKVGDIIVTGNKIMWVIERRDTEAGVRFKTMNVNGTSGSWAPPKKSVMGMDTGALVLRPLMATMGGDPATAGTAMAGMQNMLMMMAMMNGGSVNETAMDSIMPMLLMTQMQGGAGSNPMMQ